MMIPARRDFLRYTMGVAWTSALPIKAALAGRDTTAMPLVVDLIGPMAFKKCNGVIDVWMPKLTAKKHEAGIGTSVTSKELPQDDYVITGPAPFTGDPKPYTTSQCSIYSTSANDYSAKNRFIKLTLPMPRA